MHLAHSITAQTDTAPLPRARGTLRVSSKARDRASFIDGLHSAGCARAVFPRRTDAVEAIIVNTSGGLTGGDTFTVAAHAGPESRLILTTQAAERAYRSTSGLAHVRTRLSVAPGSTLTWLPQELLVFDGAGLDRQLDVDLSPDAAEFVMAEPVVFGRTAMREEVRSATFLDRITIRRDGQPLYEDRIALSGDIPARLGQSASTRGFHAMASALYVGPRAEALLHEIRALCPATAGASLLAQDVLVLRLLAQDGFLLRRALCPMLEALTGATLPRSWRL